MKTAIEQVREALDELIELRSFLPERYSMIAVHVRMDKAIAALTSLKSLEGRLTVDALANEIRSVDGNNSLGAGALAEALMPFLTKSANP